MLAVTMAGVVFLVFDLVAGRPWALTATGVTVAVLTALWAVVPAVGGEVDED